ncbi:MAG: methyltransferase domain-containing protein [Chloroflexi bacterium]|nr:methyltransferase domain-containing protein [Chloroflexota bacterium]
MDTTDLDWLTGPDGSAAAATAVTYLARGWSELRALDLLRRTYTPDQARAALALVDGRRVAAAKFPDGDSLFCDRDAAEQASSQPVAVWTARRFAGMQRIADLGCGMGGDALALAHHAAVLAVDRDPARVAMTAANAAVRGLAHRVQTVVADVQTLALPAEIDAAWLDPARRDARGRVRDPERWSPPLADALTLASGLAAAGIKLAPGIELELLPTDAEIEFVSLAGDLVEAVLWTGAFAATPRRATVITVDGLPAVLAGDPATVAPPPLAEPAHYLFDPDPAVGRAGLIGWLAADLELRQLDPSIAYLTGDRATASPFVRRFRVDGWLPFAERTLLARLRDLDAGRVEVMRRGSPVDTNALERRLNRALGGRDAHAGPALRTVALTRVRGVHVAIVCERER